MEYALPITLALIAAVPGWLAFLNQKRNLSLEERKAERDAKTDDAAGAIRGFSRLVTKLEAMVVQERKDCDRKLNEQTKTNDRRFEQMRHELLTRIVELEGKVDV